MPNLAPIAITGNTLVTSFSPQRTRSDNTIAELVSGSNLTGVKLRMTSRPQENGAHRAIIKLEVPVLATVEGLTSVVDVEIVEINIRRSQYSDAAQRTLVTDLTSKVLASQLVKDVYEGNQGFW